MRIDENDKRHIIADEGKIFRRIADELIYGFEIYLGYTYSIGGIPLPEPKLEQPEDFEEIDYVEPEPPEPIEEENEVEEEPVDEGGEAESEEEEPVDEGGNDDPEEETAQ